VRKIQRLAAVGAMAALTVALGACGSSETPSASAPEPAPAPTSAPSAAGDGVTQLTDIFGPACSKVPTEGEGSAQGMVDDPVATAASNNPLVSTLVTAVKAADLVDTLNNAEALTVYAPGNDAFAAVQAKMGDEAFNSLLADKAGLATLLSYHVVGTRYNAEQLVEMGKTEQLAPAGATVTIGGTADAPTFAGPGNATPATTLCGNIPTSNATVFVIDAVLMPTAS